jgi:hypothetical protein
MKKLLLFIPLLLLFIGCGSDKQEKSQYEKVTEKAKKAEAYIPKNNVELRNYNDAQKVYDDPTNIIWCTFSFTNPSSPLVTVPVSGKLTSSSTTFFNPVTVYGDGYDWGVAIPARSVDGLFHPNPPGYRYGFTPGGAYVDFFNLETYCSNKPTKFQRQNTKVSLAVDAGLGAADAAAQRALKNGDKREAQRIIEQAIGG